MPWKNGGGETREILVSPPGSSLDEMEWRVSLATVASDGPFSEFRGITRTLSVIRGAGIRLQIGPQVGFRELRELLTSSEPYTFDGESPTMGVLIDGTMVDLNVMSRRGVARHRVTKVRVADTSLIEASADVTLVFCVSGGVTCRAGDVSVDLGAEDCALIEGPVRSVQVVATAAEPKKPSIAGRLEALEGGAAGLFLIELYRELTRSGS
jgi:environmental stress-induced protein Ves